MHQLLLEEPKMCVPLLRSEVSGSTCLCVEQGLSPLGTNGEVCSTEVSVNSVDMIHRRATPKMTDLGKSQHNFSLTFILRHCCLVSQCLAV